MIMTWECTFCHWLNDNNNGACRNCGGQTESRFVKGSWKEVTVREPKPHHSRQSMPNTVRTVKCSQETGSA